MKVIKTKLDGCVVIEPIVYGDDRGFFLETFRESMYRKTAGITLPFVQDNHSRSSKGVLRGLHFQKSKPQGKLVRVVKGEVYDVAVDIRQGSPTYSQWMAIVLSEENKKQVWIPPGFAHGFLVLSEVADFEYKCTDYYDADDERSVLWRDPSIGISWPELNPILSARDVSAPLLSEIFT
jgi:dTDP-4-dehydrorhamnose 3,5-epimerase